jgi:hypothetical protein
MNRFAIADGNNIVRGNGVNVSGELTGFGLTLVDTTRMGEATLAAGIATVNTVSVTANSRIFITRQAAGGTLGHLAISNVVAGASFRIVSDSTSDTSRIAWVIIEPS